MTEMVEPTGAETLPGDLEGRCRAVLEANWLARGYTVPNAATYPYQWLWDSCFHALVWGHLGEDDRAVSELSHLFRTQDEAGFVPHVDYEVAPDALTGFWGRSGSSSITQPPMYGHAVAELARRGTVVPTALVERARAGLWFLLRQRQRDGATGLITIVHPWESGADDSPRWDHWSPSGFDLGSWFDLKGRLLDTVERSSVGSPLANPSFGAAPVAFNALVAYNARELGDLLGDRSLVAAAQELVDALDGQWDPVLRTWVDAGPSSATSGRIRTLDALLPVLVTGRDDVVDLVLADLLDEEAYGGAFGPAGVHRAEPAFAASTYWRGPAWPQLSYLVWLAASRRGRDDVAVELGRRLVAGAVTSGFAEYWEPDTGRGLGAVPQSWTTLAALV